jgi:hypothetical protein
MQSITYFMEDEIIENVRGTEWILHKERQVFCQPILPL